MESYSSKNKKLEIQNCRMDKVNKRVVVPFLILWILFSIACTISYEGINFGSDPDVEMLEDQTSTAEHALQGNPQQAESTPIPTNPPGDESQSPAAEAENGKSVEYSVAATDFDCVCQVDGNVTQELKINGDQLEVIGAGGDVQVYDKIGENTYRRAWMGYYISKVDGKDIRVDEERSVVITLTDNGYIMEHYQGSNSSPCCFHTFTQQN